jgi:hypothetical protein
MLKQLNYGCIVILLLDLAVWVGIIYFLRWCVRLLFR